ncbi:hypothetical protein ACP70R_021503 [Stipagrostis hirtigluma subsp. patula]
MATMRLLLLLLLLAVATSATSPETKNQPDRPLASIPYSSHFCNSTGVPRTYLPNSTFEANLAKLSAAVPSNTSASGGFFKGSVGAAPDTVYGLALCRGDTTGANCTECLRQAFSNSRSNCKNSKEAAIHLELCKIRFLDMDFLDGAANEPTSAAWEMGKHAESNNDAERVAFVAGTVSPFLRETARFAAYNTSRRFGTALKNINGSFHKLYAMAQCTPDMSPDGCFACLEDIIQRTSSPKNSNEQQGGVIGVRCSIRYKGSKFYDGDAMLIVNPDAPVVQRSKTNNIKIIATVIPLVVLSFCFIIGFRWIRSRRKGEVHSQEVPEGHLHQEEDLVWIMEGNISSEFSSFDFAQLQEATGNFSNENKLGQGGFGPVYKGKLPHGVEIAVKRLSTCSGQGLIEFKNEVQLIAKLQHANLVRLLGCCSEGDEKILVYEYLPNKSLDFFIFDKLEKRAQLDWKKRLAIIEGIAHGLLYLHKHSRLRVIHRDLKASNILLDENMNPKISDFGIAKIFSSNDVEGNTNRVVGTYGYMAPEYASEGLFSIKSDVFSFGVLLLEIVSGKRNSRFHRNGGFLNLLGYAWQLWEEGRWQELVDTSLVNEDCSSELFKCINIALLCVQENAVDRPNMWDIIRMLSTAGASLPEPKHPAYYNVMVANLEALSIDLEANTINEVTITGLDAR